MSDDPKHKHSIFEDLAHFDKTEKNGHPFDLEAEEEPTEEPMQEEGYLTDEIDHEILMHREAHFGGDFVRMLAYYQGDFIGVNPEFEIERIQYLHDVEKELQKNLAPLILSGAEAEKVAAAKQAYAQLKEIYDLEEEKNPIPRLLADLILSEDPEPKKEIEAILAQKEWIAPELLRLIKTDELYDPLFPGYARAPAAFIYCLGEMKEQRAIVPLFEILGKEITFEEECVLHALHSIGEQAKHFLLKVLTSRPITHDNEAAAYALTYFLNDQEVAIQCFEELKKSDVQKDLLLSSYLVCNLENLVSTHYKDQLLEFSQDPTVPNQIREDLKNLLRT